MHITYLAGWNRGKDAILGAIAAAGEGHRLPVIGLSFADFPETIARTDAALATAKRQPGSAIGRAAKRALIRAQYNWSRRYFTRHPGHVAMCWNGVTGSRQAFMEGAADAGAERLFVERAPFPGRITLDPAGVNFAGSVPRDPAFFRDWFKSQDIPPDAWRAMGADLTARASRRRDVGQGAAGDLSGNFLFCPLQVPNDSQVTRFGGWIDSLPHMIEVLGRAARALPDGWTLRVKEHPSSRIKLTDLVKLAGSQSRSKMILDNTTDTFTQVAASQGVITLNSSVGLQAFFYDKPVLVLGQAFFAQPGITTPIASEDALTAAFEHPEALTFDAHLRDAFMSWLDRVYYPRVTEGPDGSVSIDAEAVRAKLAPAE